MTGINHIERDLMLERRAQAVRKLKERILKRRLHQMFEHQLFLIQNALISRARQQRG